MNGGDGDPCRRYFPPSSVCTRKCRTESPSRIDSEYCPGADSDSRMRKQPCLRMGFISSFSALDRVILPKNQGSDSSENATAMNVAGTYLRGGAQWAQCGSVVRWQVWGGRVKLKWETLPPLARGCRPEKLQRTLHPRKNKEKDWATEDWFWWSSRRCADVGSQQRRTEKEIQENGNGTASDDAPLCAGDGVLDQRPVLVLLQQDHNVVLAHQQLLLAPWVVVILQRPQRHSQPRSFPIPNNPQATPVVVIESSQRVHTSPCLAAAATHTVSTRQTETCSRSLHHGLTSDSKTTEESRGTRYSTLRAPPPGKANKS